MILTHLVLFSFLAGASPADAAAPPVVTETLSGGWRHARDGSDTERRVRIHAERVKLGIIAPDPEKPAPVYKHNGAGALEAAGGEISGVPATL